MHFTLSRTSIVVAHWEAPTDIQDPRRTGRMGLCEHLRAGSPRRQRERSCSPEIHQEHMLDFLQDFQLSEHIANLVSFNALLFVHVLHGIHLLRVSLLHNTHLKYHRRGRKKEI